MNGSLTKTCYRIGDLGVLRISIYMTGSCFNCCRIQGKIPSSLKLKVIGYVLLEIMNGFIPIVGDSVNIICKLNKRSFGSSEKIFNPPVNSEERQLQFQRTIEEGAMGIQTMVGKIDRIIA